MADPTSTLEQNGAGVTKHRACDECRSRKLACSKEADGCARCKRENIPCHYSAQKPMGRPRKRPRDEATDPAALADELPGLGEDISSGNNSKNLMMALPPDTADPGMAFLNFLTGGDFQYDPSLNMGPTAQPAAVPKGGWEFGLTGNDFGEVAFTSASHDSRDLREVNIDPALIATVDTPETTPNLSADSSNSSESHPSPPSQTTAAPNCACTANLYLALDSMQKESTDVTAAMRQARMAAKTAYDVVNCPSCEQAASTLPHRMPPQTVAVHNFQNLMLLSTLIPSIVACYEQILVLIDRESEKATKEGRQIPFTLSGYGGCWGPLSDDACGVNAAFEHKLMEPAMWRLTVRALLRVDVYGMSHDERNLAMGGGSGGGCGGGSRDPFHLGLKDIVVQLENRSRSRHAIIDPMILSGAWEDNKSALRMHKTGEKPTCAKIIEIARNALDNLVIA